jgi:hypothetical protein
MARTDVRLEPSNFRLNFSRPETIGMFRLVLGLRGGTSSITSPGGKSPKIATCFYRLFSVMKDDPQCAAAPRSHAADTMPKIDPVGPSLTLYRAIVHRECYGVSLAQRNDLGS